MTIATLGRLRLRQCKPYAAAPVVLLAILGGIAGCAAWRGELSPAHNRRLETHLRNIHRADLRSLSTDRPRTIEDEIDTVKQRRETKVPTSAPASVALSVEDLRLKTLRNNLDLNVVFLDPTLAQTFVSEEKAKFDATIFGGVDYKRQDLPRLDSDLVDLDGSSDALDGEVVKLTRIEQTKDKLTLDAGIEVPLPTGGKLKLRSVFDEENKLAPERFEQFVSSLKFSYSQPLLRNAGIEANTASIRIARLDAQAVGARTKLTAIRVLAGAEKAYWRTYGAQKMLEVRIQQYDLAFDNLEFVRKRVEQGLSPKIEIVRAEVGVARRLEALIMSETNLRIQQRELKRILNENGMPIDSPTAINIISPPQLLRFMFEREKMTADALANRMEMLELELKLAADAIKIDLARNKALPLFVLDFEYGILDRQASMGSAWQRMWDFDDTEFRVGLRGEIPVTNDAREARLRRAILARSQRMATGAQRELAIKQDVYDALDVLDQNWQRILAARQNVIVSGVNYEVELKQFNEGLRTMREVLEVLTQLGEAQIREVKAIVAYQVAQIDLAFATGTLLGYAGTDFTPIPLTE
ncbi:MAG: TolC family protein [Phycisphaerales bacterium]|nr:TolC family protein [Phycisphaerales bacterium]